MSIAGDHEGVAALIAAGIPVIDQERTEAALPPEVLRLAREAAARRALDGLLINTDDDEGDGIRRLGEHAQSGDGTTIRRLHEHAMRPDGTWSGYFVRSVA
jgi:hypothetical protein